MEEQEHIMKVDEKEEKLDSNKEYIEISNEEEENNNLIPENDNDNKIEINNNENNIEQKEEKNTETMNYNNINTNLNINPQENKEKKDENLIVGDYLITMQYTKFLHLPYFKFGNIFNFYYPCYKFKSNQIYLSQMPTPPFGIVVTQCKKNIFNKFIFL